MNSDKDMVGMKNRASMYGMINDKEEKCSKKNDCLLNKQDACMEPTLRQTDEYTDRQIDMHGRHLSIPSKTTA